MVASPGDVQAERKALFGVRDELNKGIGKELVVQIELFLWETDAHPGFHPEGPQGLIDGLLPFHDCDVLIGIFWKRFGTPTHDAKSGTEHEFLQAYAARQQHKRPQIMVYFNQKVATPQTPEEAIQWSQVLEFRRQFPKEGLWWPYKGKAQFADLVRKHLTRFILELPSPTPSRPKHKAPSTKRPTASAARRKTTTSGSVSPELAASMRLSYLNWLTEQVRAVPLSGVDPKSIHEETRRDLDLAAVYTALMTQRPEAADERMAHPEREHKRLPALAVLNNEPRLALLGDPGSGKSTFVNFVALCMAGELLGRTEANLKVLRAPLPDETQTHDEQKKAQPQPWTHGPLLPLRVVLREFVARGLSGSAARQPVNDDTLWKFLIAELPETVRDFAGPLRAELLNHGGLLLLDGLDEVPEAEARREQVKTAVEGFAAVFPKVRIVVTSRTYAYQKQDWKLTGFREAVLAPFEPAQMRAFVERWYTFVGQVRKLTAEDAQGRAVQLNTAIKRNPRLLELAERPLLLTLMASLHAWRGGTLPEQREELYADAVELLLDQWESQKFTRLPDGGYAVAEPSLVEWLRVDHKKMRQLLNRLAFEAHHAQPSLEEGTADIAQEPLVSGLLQLNPSLKVNPGELIAYLRDRAGILEPRGVGVYAFPHRTFQEYLAACHLTEQDEFPDNIADLLRAEPNRWREATLLAGAKAMRGVPANVWTLAEALCCDKPAEEKTVDESGYWGALLAAQVLIENNCLEQVNERKSKTVARIRRWLRCTLSHGALPPRDRAQAGDALASIGDPRFHGAEVCCLPVEPLLGFIEILAGPFVMGSDPRKDKDAQKDEQDQHIVNLSRYYIATYPVTVAQFAAFVAATGYAPRDDDWRRGLVNHPVVNVTWHDAQRYCEWLTEQLHNSKHIPTAVRARARTGNWGVTRASVAGGVIAAGGADGRLYPWGDTWEEGYANTDEAGIGRTSAVGCFPQDCSPHRCLDMAGNILE
ncbi:MAG: SUMF1/EgtB/PvdO family nonheme iron enzyme [Candidatus Binatia bacterium]